MFKFDFARIETNPGLFDSQLRSGMYNTLWFTTGPRGPGG